MVGFTFDSYQMYVFTLTLGGRSSRRASQPERAAGATRAAAPLLSAQARRRYAQAF
ncbi:hypothetical protein KCP78_19375 [Salmonella enterica subsp. enterica]|nr:hypothetical protein KCP78_19375 [Salmonella enterica subsp. enterica]